MANQTPLVMDTTGLLQQQPVGDTLKLRGNLDVDTYIVTATGLLALVPGTGYPLQADTAGNLRGAYATDLQRSRSLITEVASGGYTVICGGGRNMASNTLSAVVGGFLCWSRGYASFVGGGQSNVTYGSYTTICGGRNNYIPSTGAKAIICGGSYNTAEGEHCVIAGGESNTMDDDCTHSFIGSGYSNDMVYATHSFIGSGENNTLTNSAHVSFCCGYNCSISGSSNSFIGSGDTNILNTGSSSSAIVCGNDNTITSALYSFIGGGADNSIDDGAGHVICGGRYHTISTSSYATICGGYENIATGTDSTVIGVQAKSELHGEFSQASGEFSAVGDAQTSVLVARNQTEDATQTVLFLDGVNDRLIMPQDTTWLFNIYVAGHRDTSAESAGYQLQGVIRRAGAANPVIVGGAATQTVIAEDDATWNANVQVDAVNDALEIYVVGAAAKNINWVARIELVVVKG